jgi:hypothetical protein
MASTRASYPDLCLSARIKTGDFCLFPRSNSFRRAVAELMVQMHWISPDLADYHVSQMDFPELRRRVRFYLGMELSAVRSKKQSEADFFPVFGLATTTAGRSALNCVPLLSLPPESWQFTNPMPELEEKNRDRRPGRFLPRLVVLPELESKNRESSESAETPIQGEAFGFEVFT